ncbi:ABC transporter ATP-binding protein [Clostridia bacterium]|nr:ABC transporter ATP-binding protein [Clostridia bacterium]
MFVEIKNVSKSYGEAGSYVQVLKGVNTELTEGHICVVLGPSGSGKSTLLNVVGGLDKIDSGEIIVDGNNITKLVAKKVAAYRRKYLGFVFQFYNLIPNLTLRENIQVCEYLSSNSLDINELLDVLNLTEHQNKYPSQLSGGQQQRCSVARALAKNPKLLLCDEPTGALDYNSSREMLVLLEKINQRYGTTMLIITHNEAIQKMAHKVIHIRDGSITESVNNTPLSASGIEW